MKRKINLSFFCYTNLTAKGDSMEHTIDWDKVQRESIAYVATLENNAMEIVKANPYLLQAFLDYNDVKHNELDPELEKTWEHNMSWILHKRFMEKAGEIGRHQPELNKQLNELTDIMKNIACLVDLALLPDYHKAVVQSWAERYKEAYSKKK